MSRNGGGEGGAAGLSVVEAALAAEYWGEYAALMELWRMGEVFSLERWGRPSHGAPARPSEGETRTMRLLRGQLEALMVGFGE